jgi:hypothetical protein
MGREVGISVDQAFCITGGEGISLKEAGAAHHNILE